MSRNINEIIIHCAATRPNWWQGKSAQQKTNEIRRWHVEDRQWSDIGYHYTVDRDGTVVAGRPVERSGAHTRGHNKNSIGICLLGGHGSTASDDFLDNFTEDQDQALRNLIANLKDEFPSIRKVSGHNQYSTKACPGFAVPAWMNHKPAPVAAAPVKDTDRSNPVQSKTMQASAVQMATGAGGAIAALQALEGPAQIIVSVGGILIVLMAIWIMRERLKKWAEGIR